MPLQDPFAPVKALLADMQKLHFKVQLIRFLRLFVTAFLTQVTFLPGPSITWKAVVALVPPAVEAVVREIWPSLPVAKLLAALVHHGSTADPLPASLKAGATTHSRWATAVQDIMPTNTPPVVPASLLNAFQTIADHLDPTGIPETPKPDLVVAPPLDTSSIAASGVQFGTLAPAAPIVTDVPLPAADDSPAAKPESTGTPAQ